LGTEYRKVSYMPDSNGTNGNSNKTLEVRLAKLQTVVHDSLIRQLEVLVAGVEKVDDKFDEKIEKLTERAAQITTELTVLKRVVDEWDEYKKDAKKRENDIAAANTKGRWNLVGTILTVIGLIAVALLKG
jgi:hypothetical protein